MRPQGTQICVMKAGQALCLFTHIKRRTWYNVVNVPLSRSSSYQLQTVARDGRGVRTAYTQATSDCCHYIRDHVSPLFLAGSAKSERSDTRRYSGIHV